MLTTAYPFYQGDLRGVFVYKLIKALKKYTDVKLVTLKGYNALTSGAGILHNIKVSWKAKILFPFYWLHLSFNMNIASRRCDLIHTNWGPIAFFAILTKPIHRKKILLTERSSFLISTNNLILKLINKFTYSHVDSLITISNFSKNLIQHKYNINEVKVIMNGVDVIKRKNKSFLKNKLKLPKSVRIFLYVGRLDERKGVNYLIQAFNQLKNKDSYLVIIGRGDYNLNINDDKIIFLGDKLQTEVFDYMLASDVFILPSLNETGGNVLLEARACGLPIISTKVGWAEDIINDGKDGFFIEKQDSQDIYDKLSKVLNHNTFLRLSKNSKNIKINSWDDCAKKYAKEYKGLICAPEHG